MVSLNAENGTYTVCEKKPHFCCVVPEVFNIQLCFKGALGLFYKKIQNYFFTAKCIV